MFLALLSLVVTYSLNILSCQKISVCYLSVYSKYQYRDKHVFSSLTDVDDSKMLLIILRDVVLMSYYKMCPNQSSVKLRFYFLPNYQIDKNVVCDDHINYIIRHFIV